MRCRSSRTRALAAAAALVLLAGACTNTPPAPGPTEARSTPASEQTPNRIVIGVDTVGGGYNPHHLADVSTTTSALAELALPSVFRTGADGAPKLDKTLMRAAKVVSGKPFTVAYRIRQDASWSDGAPIAAEDFDYLADQMRTQPGTVNPAGYRLIEDVDSRDGGKRVVVRFSARYPGWRSLFTFLLPSHLLKDIPGGWHSALAASYPAYGGPFAIKSVDVARGEILIERNERYWEKPSAVDQLVLRRSDPAGPAEALRKHNNQLALTAATPGSVAALKNLGGRIELHTVARPVVAEVLLRPTSKPLADHGVRAAVAALVDRTALIGAAGAAPELHADAQVTAPSERSYAPTLPADRRKPDPARAARLLTTAGYAYRGGQWLTPEGKPLELVVASPGKREPYATLAKDLAAQLTAAGVQARAVTPDARELFAVDPAAPDAEPIDVGDEELPIDIVVGPRTVSGDPASTFASRFACRTTDETDDADADIEPGNVAGFCDKGLRATVRETLTGERELARELPALEPRLWQANVTIPLFQLADTLALSKDVAGVTEGPPLAGPFGAAVNWIRISE